MISVYFPAAFWFLAAVISTLVASRLKKSIHLIETTVGIVMSYEDFPFHTIEKRVFTTIKLK